MGRSVVREGIMNKEEKLDIIMGTHNNLGMTIRCLETLYDYTHVPFRLTLVDDSTDLTPQWIKWYKKQHPDINLIRPEEKLFSGNQFINIALKNTTGDLFVSMGNSTIVEPQWLNAALEVMNEHPEIGIMGFKLLKRSGCIEHAGIVFTPDMPHHMNYGVDEASHRHTYIKDIGIVGWALVLVRRAAIPDGGLDEKTYLGFAGYEDVDNCLTIQQNGWKVVYCGLGCAYHWSLSTRGKGDMDEIAARHEENRKRFVKKWGNLEEKVEVLDRTVKKVG